jgi:hypothetical protein
MQSQKVIHFLKHDLRPVGKQHVESERQFESVLQRKCAHLSQRNNKHIHTYTQKCEHLLTEAMFRQSHV